MKKLSFQLAQQEFIELNKLLKLMQLAESGGAASELIVSGKVLLNGAAELQKRKKVRAGDVVKCCNQTIEVS